MKSVIRTALGDDHASLDRFKGVFLDEFGVYAPADPASVKTRFRDRWQSLSDRFLDPRHASESQWVEVVERAERDGRIRPRSTFGTRSFPTVSTYAPGQELHEDEVARVEARLMWRDPLIRRLNEDGPFRDQVLSKVLTSHFKTAGVACEGRQPLVGWTGQYPTFISDEYKIECCFDGAQFALWVETVKGDAQREQARSSIIDTITGKPGSRLTRTGSCTWACAEPGYQHLTLVEGRPFVAGSVSYVCQWKRAPGQIYTWTTAPLDAQGCYTWRSVLDGMHTIRTRGSQEVEGPGHADLLPPGSSMDVAPPDTLAALYWFAPAERIKIMRSQQDPTQIGSIQFLDDPRLSFKVTTVGGKEEAVWDEDPRFFLARNQSPPALQEALAPYTRYLLLMSAEGRYEIILPREHLLDKMTTALLGTAVETGFPQLPDWIESLIQSPLRGMGRSTGLGLMADCLRAQINGEGHLETDDAQDHGWLVYYHLVRGDHRQVRWHLDRMDELLQRAHSEPGLVPLSLLLQASALAQRGDPQWLSTAMRFAALVEENQLLHASSEDGLQPQMFLRSALLQTMLCMAPKGGKGSQREQQEHLLLRAALRLMQDSGVKCIDQMGEVASMLRLDGEAVAHSFFLLPQLGQRLDELNQLYAHDACRASHHSAGARLRKLARMAISGTSSARSSTNEERAVAALLGTGEAVNSGSTVMVAPAGSSSRDSDSSQVRIPAVFTQVAEAALGLVTGRGPMALPDEAWDPAMSWDRVPLKVNEISCEGLRRGFPAYYRLAWGTPPKGLSRKEQSLFRQRVQTLRGLFPFLRSRAWPDQEQSILNVLRSASEDPAEYPSADEYEARLAGRERAGEQLQQIDSPLLVSMVKAEEALRARNECIQKIYQAHISVACEDPVTDRVAELMRFELGWPWAHIDISASIAGSTDICRGFLAYYRLSVGTPPKGLPASELPKFQEAVQAWRKTIGLLRCKMRVSDHGDAYICAVFLLHSAAEKPDAFPDPNALEELVDAYQKADRAKSSMVHSEARLPQQGPVDAIERKAAEEAAQCLEAIFAAHRKRIAADPNRTQGWEPPPLESFRLANNWAIVCLDRPSLFEFRHGFVSYYRLAKGTPPQGLPAALLPRFHEQVRKFREILPTLLSKKDPSPDCEEPRRHMIELLQSVVASRPNEFPDPDTLEALAVAHQEVCSLSLPSRLRIPLDAAPTAALRDLNQCLKLIAKAHHDRVGADPWTTSIISTLCFERAFGERRWDEVLLAEPFNLNNLSHFLPYYRLAKGTPPKDLASAELATFHQRAGQFRALLPNLRKTLESITYALTDSVTICTVHLLESVVARPDDFPDPDRLEALVHTYVEWADWQGNLNEQRRKEIALRQDEYVQRQAVVTQAHKAVLDVREKICDVYRSRHRSARTWAVVSSLTHLVEHAAANYTLPLPESLVCRLLRFTPLDPLVRGYEVARAFNLVGNGRPRTAKDVVYSLLRMTSLGSIVTAGLEMVQGVQQAMQFLPDLCAALDGLGEEDRLVFQQAMKRSDRPVLAELGAQLAEDDRTCATLVRRLVLGDSELRAVASNPEHPGGAAEEVEFFPAQQMIDERHDEPMVANSLARVNENLLEYFTRSSSDLPSDDLSTPEGQQRLSKGLGLLREEAIRPILEGMKEMLMRLARRPPSSAQMDQTDEERLRSQRARRAKSASVEGHPEGRWLDLVQAFARDDTHWFASETELEEGHMPLFDQWMYRYLLFAIRDKQLAAAEDQLAALSKVVPAQPEYALRLAKLKEHLLRPSAYDYAHFSDRFLRSSMVFEVVHGCRLWERQVQQLERVIQEVRDGASHLVMQAGTGAGKTFYGGPKKNLVLADGHVALVNCFTPALAPVCAAQVRHALSTVAGRPCLEIQSTRAHPLEERQLRALIARCERSILCREAFTSKKTDFQSLDLIFREKYLEYCDRLRSRGVIRRLAGDLATSASHRAEKRYLNLYRDLLRLIRRGMKLDADEAHEMFRRKDELNHPLSGKAYLEEGTVRSTLDSVFLMFADPQLAGLLPGNGQVAFDLDAYEQTGKARLAELLGCRIALCPGQLEAFHEYLKDRTVPAPDFVRSHPQREQIALLRGLINVLIPEAFKLTFCVHFGLPKDPEEADPEIAIPYLGNDRPSKDSKIKNPLEELLKTAISFAHRGLNSDQTRKLLSHQLAQAAKEAEAVGLPVEQTEEALLLREWTGLSFDACRKLRDDAGDLPAELPRLVSQHHAAVVTYVAAAVAPKMTHFQRSLRSDSHQFVSMFETSVAATATPEHEGSFPVGTEILWDPGTLGETVDFLMQHCNDPEHIHALDATNPMQRLDEILPRFFAPGSRAAMIVDGGALFYGLSGEEVADRILTYVRQQRPDIHGVIYNDDQGELRVREQVGQRGDVYVQGSLPPNELSHITYLGHFFRTGSNVLQAAGTEGVVLMGDSSTLEDICQSVGRMRGLRSSGQRIHMAMNRTLYAKMLEGDQPSMGQIIRYLRVNEAHEKADDSFLASYQKLNNLVYSAVRDRILDTEEIDDTAALTSDYKELFVSDISLDFWALFGEPQELRSPKPVLEEHMEKLWTKFGRDTRFSARRRAQVRALMERIVEEAPQYTPERVLVGAQGPTSMALGLGQSEQIQISQQVAAEQQAHAAQQVSAQQKAHQDQHHEVDQQLEQQMDESIQQALPPPRRLSEERARWAKKTAYLANLDWLVAADPEGPVDLKKVSFFSVPSSFEASSEFTSIADQFTPTMYWTSNALGIYVGGTLAKPYSEVQQPIVHLLLVQQQGEQGIETSSIALTQEEGVLWTNYLRRAKAHKVNPNLKFGVYDLVHQKIVQTTADRGLMEGDLQTDQRFLEDLARWGYLGGYTTVYRAPNPTMRENVRRFMGGWLRGKTTDLVRCYGMIRKRLGVEPYAKSQMEAMMTKALRVDPFALHRDQRYMS
ncbi:MAG: hypothetical protein ACOYKZ_03040 [Chlamydiia bacterium]